MRRRGEAQIARLAAARSIGSSTQGMAAAAALVAASLVASRVLGLIRLTVFAAIWGGTPALNDYNAAFRIPDTLFTIVAGGALSSAFVPVFAGLLGRRQEGDAWRAANTVLNSLFVALVVCAGVAFIFAPQITRLLYPGPHVNTAQTAQLTRIMLVQPILLGLGGLFAAMQNSYDRFVLPAVAPVVYNVVIILGAVVFGPHYGIQAAAWAVVVGAVIMFEIQIWGVAAESRFYRVSINWRLPEAREVLKLMGPRLLGLSAFQLMLVVTFWLASFISNGATEITYAWALVMFPIGAVGTAVGTAVFPTLSRQSAVAQTQLLEQTVRSSIRAIVFLALPSTAGLILLRVPVITLLFAHGSWPASLTAATAFALGFYAFGVVPLATTEVAARAFYALKNTRTPVAIAIVAAIIDAILCVTLIHFFPRSRGTGGLGLATSIAVWIQIILLISALRRYLPGLIDREFKGAMGGMVLSALGMSLTVYVALRLLEHVAVGGPTLHSLVEVVGSVAVGVATYGLIARAFRLPEVARLTRLSGRVASFGRGRGR